MKKFSDMSQIEINALNEEDFESISPFEKRSCYDCSYLKCLISWWCTNKQAIKIRGTSIPGCIKCPYWKPDCNIIDEKYKIEEFGFKKRN